MALLVSGVVAQDRDLLRAGPDPASMRERLRGVQAELRRITAGAPWGEVGAGRPASG